MRIQHNIMAMSAYRNYTNNVSAMKKNLEKLSSGYKINRAGDDAAGLAISEKMRAQITGLETAQKNAKDGISLVQTAEGALTEVHDMLNRMVELATQSANGTYDNTTDRNQMQKEIDQLRSEIDRIADSSNFNGIKLLDGSMSGDAASIVEIGKYTGKAAASEYTTAAASGALTWSTASKGTSVASVGKYVLHSNAGEDQLGEIKVDLSALSWVATKAGSKLKITIGSAVATLAASVVKSSWANGITGADIAKYFTGSNVRASKVVVLQMGTNGKLEFKKATSNLSKGAVAFKATVGEGSNAGVITFKAAVIVNKATKASTIFGTNPATKATVLASTGGTIDSKALAKVKDAQKKTDLTSLVVKASASKADSLSGWNNLGVQGKNIVSAAGADFGNTGVKVAASKITDGMRITLGTGENQVTKYFKLKKDDSAVPDDVAEGDIIDLSDLVTSASNPTIAASKASQVTGAIANAFNDAEALGGIWVGAQGSYVTLSEQVDGTKRTSLATEDVQKAMSSIKGFQSLMKMEGQSQTAAAVDGSKTLTVDTSKLGEGMTMEITVGSKTQKLQFSADPNAKAADGATLVSLEGDVANNLKAALEKASGVKVKVSVDGGKVSVTYTDTKDVKVKDASAKLTGMKGLTLQIGDTADPFNQLSVTIADMHTKALGIDAANMSIANQDDAAKAVDLIKTAINKVSDLRGTLGATQNRLDHTINNLSVMTENIQDAESTIRDVDVADEMMAYTKNNILIQSAQAMLAQANQVPQGVLQLLQ